MMPSPIPMSVWTPTMAPNTVSNATGADAPNSHSMENATAAITTEAQAARPVAPTTPPPVEGNTRRRSRKTA